MKKIILLSSLIVFMSFNVSAQNKKDKIIKLFELMKTDKMMDSMVDNISNMFANKNTGLKDAKNDSIQKEYMNYVMEETKTLSKKLINEDMVTLYDKYFTEPEIQKFINFYLSPEGKKLIEATPNMQNDIMAIMATKYMPELTTKFKNKLEESKK